MTDETSKQFQKDVHNGVVLKTPENFGKAFQDFSKNGPQCQTMYVIEVDDNPLDTSAVPKIYGAYWSETPDPVNQIAMALWPQFGSPHYREDEDNVDGKATKPGECYAASAGLGCGQASLSMSVRKVNHNSELRNFRTDLVKQVLASRGLPTNGDKTEMIKRAQTAKILPQ